MGYIPPVGRRGGVQTRCPWKRAGAFRQRPSGPSTLHPPSLSRPHTPSLWSSSPPSLPSTLPANPHGRLLPVIRTKHPIDHRPCAAFTLSTRAFTHRVLQQQRAVAVLPFRFAYFSIEIPRRRGLAVFQLLRKGRSYGAMTN